MCLLIVATRVHPGVPLLIGANRDERFERPATAMTVLRHSRPRVLGGRDEQAGGTWLAVNEAGVFAGLTNGPAPGGRDPTKRSRGELPLLLAGHRSAASAIEHFAASVDPSAYNPALLLVGDRRSLFAIDMTDGRSLRTQSLAPGLHVLENRPLAAPSPKVERVRGLVGDLGDLSAVKIEARVVRALRDHEVPPQEPSAAGEPGRALPAVTSLRPAGAGAACVHTPHYGTMWSGLVTVRASPGSPPRVRYTDAAPCRSAYRDAGSMF